MIAFLLGALLTLLLARHLGAIRVLYEDFCTGYYVDAGAYVCFVCIVLFGLVVWPVVLTGMLGYLLWTRVLARGLAQVTRRVGKEKVLTFFLGPQR